MDSYRIFHADTHLQTPISSFWTPKAYLKGLCVLPFSMSFISFVRTRFPSQPSQPGQPGWLAGWLEPVAGRRYYRDPPTLPQVLAWEREARS